MNSKQTDFPTAGPPGESGFIDEKTLLAELAKSFGPNICRGGVIRIVQNQHQYIELALVLIRKSCGRRSLRGRIGGIDHCRQFPDLILVCIWGQSQRRVNQFLGVLSMALLGCNFGLNGISQIISGIRFDRLFCRMFGVVQLAFFQQPAGVDDQLVVIGRGD